MKVQAFKNLIKEAVREVIKEEIMSNNGNGSLNESKTFSFTSEDVPQGNIPGDVRNTLRMKMGEAFGFSAPQSRMPQVNTTPDPSAGNPYLAFIQDAAQNMDARDYAGLKNM